ncbi:DUF4328 domain-containing protein [Kitasatospora sp. NPDC127059]|uniref:DUF4328 domain-containing protein n=1 Tax=unclassified Kitasatospora TaxID=2633591 RepID=UPI00365F130E
MNDVQYGGTGRTSDARTDRRRPLAGWAAAAVVLIAVAVLREVLLAVTSWRDYLLIHDYINGAATEADLEAADTDVLTTVVSSVAAMFVVWIAAGVPFLVWLWRARVNAEAIGGRDSQRRARLWVVGAWTSPVANLWYPYQVVSDIWQASAPRLRASATLVKAWWVCYLLAQLVKPIQWRMASGEWGGEQDALSSAYVTTLLSALLLAAGVLLILVIRQVTAWQTEAPGTAGGGR